MPTSQRIQAEEPSATIPTHAAVSDIEEWVTPIMLQDDTWQSDVPSDQQYDHEGPSRPVLNMEGGQRRQPQAPLQDIDNIDNAEIQEADEWLNRIAVEMGDG